jgi:hypothetical protein
MARAIRVPIGMTDLVILFGSGELRDSTVRRLATTGRHRKPTVTSRLIGRL